MGKDFENELQKAENWDYDNAETRAPVKASRVVVSVSFSREHLFLISKSAERSGKKISEFIREAALDKAQNRGLETTVLDYGSTGPLWVERNLPTSTRTLAQIKEQEINEDEPILTS